MNAGGERPDSDRSAPADLVRVVVQLPGGAVTLLPRRAPIGSSASIRGRTLAVVAASSTATTAVIGRLPGGTAWFEASILPGDRPAVAVADLSEADALGLGRALGLGEIFYWDGRRGRLIVCD